MRIIRDGETLKITLEVPLEQTGDETYGNGKWTAPAVGVFIDDAPLYAETEGTTPEQAVKNLFIALKKETV